MISHHTFTRTDNIMNRADSLMIKADCTPDAKRVPGEKQCQYCKAAGRCPELESIIERVKEFDMSTLKEQPLEKVEQLMKDMRAIKKACTSVEQELIRRMLNGERGAVFKVNQPKSIVWQGTELDKIRWILSEESSLPSEDCFKADGELYSPRTILSKILDSEVRDKLKALTIEIQSSRVELGVR